MARSRKVSTVANSALASAQEGIALMKANRDTWTGPSTRDSYQNFGLALGMGTDNALSESTYGFNPITRNRVQLEWLHRGSWLGGVAIDLVADDMTRAGISLSESKMAPEETGKLQTAVNNWQLWQSINDTVRWSRLYGGCIAAILIDGQDPSTPLDIDRVGKNSFRGLFVLDRWMLDPSVNDVVPSGPNLMVPRTYFVTVDGTPFMGKRIHHTRCLRMEGIRLPYWQRVIENLWGISVLERIYDRMVAFDSATTGAAQSVYKSYLRTIKIKGLRGIATTGGEAAARLAAYVAYMRRYQGIEGFTLIDAEDDFQIQGNTSFSAISEALNQFGQQLAGALQIPLVRLFGTSPGGLNSSGESDLRTYYDGIHQRQEHDIRIPLTRILKVVCKSEGIIIPDDFDFKFNPLWVLQEAEKSSIAAQDTNTIINAHSAGLVGIKLALSELRASSETTGIWTNITDEVIKEAEEPPPPGMEGGMPGAAGGAPGQQGMPGGEEMPPNENEAQEEPPPPKPIPARSVLPEGTAYAHIRGNKASGPANSNKEESDDAAPKRHVISPGTRYAQFRVTKDEKSSKELAIYVNHAVDGHVCADCSMFDPPASCNAVAGPISPAGHCSFWTAKENNLRISSFQGLPVFIETAKGERRRQDWPIMPAHYGFITMTNSPEKNDGLDVFIGDNKACRHCWIIDQIDPKSEEFDEHKVMLGFESREAAVKCYTDSYNDNAMFRIGSVRRMTMPAFKDWLNSSGWRNGTMAAE